MKKILLSIMTIAITQTALSAEYSVEANYTHRDKEIKQWENVYNTYWNWNESGNKDGYLIGIRAQENTGETTTFDLSGNVGRSNGKNEGSLNAYMGPALINKISDHQNLGGQLKLQIGLNLDASQNYVSAAILPAVKIEGTLGQKRDENRQEKHPYASLGVETNLLKYYKDKSSSWKDIADSGFEHSLKLTAGVGISNLLEIEGSLLGAMHSGLTPEEYFNAGYRLQSGRVQAKIDGKIHLGDLNGARILLKAGAQFDRQGVKITDDYSYDEVLIRHEVKSATGGVEVLF